METKEVRVNGHVFTVPYEEMTDPDKYRGEPCGSTEPYWGDSSGGATCTLEPHAPEVAHIAHDGEWNVIAIWTVTPYWEREKETTC